MQVSLSRSVRVSRKIGVPVDRTLSTNDSHFAPSFCLKIRCSTKEPIPRGLYSLIQVIEYHSFSIRNYTVHEGRCAFMFEVDKTSAARVTEDDLTPFTSLRIAFLPCVKGERTWTRFCHSMICVLRQCCKATPCYVRACRSSQSPDTITKKRVIRHTEGANLGLQGPDGSKRRI